jgi:hypothetical protein
MGTRHFWRKRGSMMLRDDCLKILGQTPEGLSLQSLGTQLGSRKDPDFMAAIEILLTLSPETRKDNDNKWRLIGKSRSSELLAAIESYADITGKKIFRVSSALAALPPHEHPTEDELRQALESSHGRYELRPNAMIRRKG